MSIAGSMTNPPPSEIKSDQSPSLSEASCQSALDLISAPVSLLTELQCFLNIFLNVLHRPGLACIEPEQNINSSQSQ